ncbi:MAG: phosphoribosylformylglycinamidine synthase, partial [Chlamydiia bacterium]|nr:phosphoribosylformylglycinamidine synthase [Chlamydiia bacterium]
MKNSLIIIPKSSGAKLKNRIRDWLGIHVRGATSARKIDFESSLTPKRAFELFGDAVQEEALQSAARYDWVIEVRYKQGVTDTATLTASAAAGEPVHCSQLTLIQGDLPFADVERLTVELLANPLIQEYSITRSRRVAVEEVDLDQQLGLALSAQEVDAIKTWYAGEEVQEARRTLNLPKGPTDVEIECLAQTWSEHCKHKIFNATIHMQGKTIRSLFKTYIAAATEKLAPEKPWLLSVFKDNAGIVALNDDYSFCFKVETHNSPSALDPYGGALTGILGVNRDIMGAGLGARLVANTNVLCFASPSTTRVPKGLHHPKRVREGVRLGIEHGGNKSGVPTINGALLYDPSYIGKPLVYCGSVGILP